MVEAMEIQKGLKRTDVGSIPIDWAEEKLNKVCALSKMRINPITSNSNFKCVELEHLSQETGRLLGIADSNDLKSQKTVFNKGDILFGKLRPYLKKFLFVDFDGVCTTEIWVLKPSSEIVNSWLYYIIQTNRILEAANQTEGTKMPRADWKIVGETLIPLPPTKAEQAAIAEALNDADALITELEKLIAKKKAIKQGAMQELLKPKEGWEIKKLGTVANIRRGASPRPIKDPKWFSDRGRGWIRISDVTSSSVYLNSTTQYLSEDGARNSVAVDKGDLIMSICATIGVPIIINIPACIHDGFVLFKNYEKIIDTFFLYFFLQAQTEILIGKGQPGTQKNLNTTIVGNIEIAYPNIEKQQDIGLILRDIDIELSGLKKKLDKYKMLKQGMMQNLLTGRIRLV